MANEGTSRDQAARLEEMGIVEDDGSEALAALEAEQRDREKLQRQALDKAFGNFGYIVMPGEADPPILNPALRTALHHWLFEMNATKELKAAGLKPRTRALLSGPPGCGKTTLAHHIAARLGVPMVVIQAHVLMSKYVNESGERIGRLFRAARKSADPVALFFDEFDATAKSREGKGRNGAEDERASITISFMQELDRYEGLLFAATNEPGNIDRAIWRRFQMQIEIGLPGEVERDAIVRLYMRPFNCEEPTVKYLSDLFAGASPALIRECCETLKRGLVLASKMNLSTELPDMMRRLVAVVAPADEAEPPALWTNTFGLISGSADVPWPPVRAK